MESLLKLRGQFNSHVEKLLKIEIPIVLRREHLELQISFMRNLLLCHRQLLPNSRDRDRYSYFQALFCSVYCG